MDDIADHLDQAADAVRAVDARVAAAGVAPAAFGATEIAAGLPARIGRTLHAHWTAVLNARSREATSVFYQLSDAAQAVRTTQREYAETDDLVRRRIAREM